MRSKLLAAMFLILLPSASVLAAAYTTLQWGLDKTTSPYNFGANINGTWSNLGTVSPTGVWSLPSDIVTFLQSGTGAVSRTVNRVLYNVYSVEDFGADPTGVVDSTAAMNAAALAAAGRVIQVPPGDYKLTDKVTLYTGTTVQCAGRTKTNFRVNSTSFNMSANGVFIFSFGDSIQMRDCGIYFTQPDTTARANIIAYPPGIYAVGSTRFTLSNVRINAAYTCLNATGNTGGSMIDNLECGGIAQSNVIAFDDARDFVHVDRLECAFFGYTPGSNVFNSVYMDGTVNCMTLGRVDGFAADTISLFRNNIIITSNANLGGIPFLISNLQLDANARIEVNGGRTYISNVYSSAGNISTIPANPVLLSSGVGTNLTVQNYDAWVDGLTVCNASATNSGYLYILGGNLNHSNTASAAACVNGGGHLEVHDTKVVIPLSNRTVAFFDESGAGSSMVLDGVTSGSAGSTTGNAFSFATDNAVSKVVGSTFPNWAHNLPFTTSLGYYDLAEQDTCTVTPAFQTVGDSVLTTSASSCTYMRKGSNVKITTSSTFNTNAFTTAAGAFGLQTNAPTILSGQKGLCSLTSMSNVTSTALQTAPFVSANSIYFRQLLSNALETNQGVANVLPSKTGIVYGVECDYRVR